MMQLKRALSATALAGTLFLAPSFGAQAENAATTTKAAAKSDAATSGAAAGTAADKTPIEDRITEFTLDNGMQVVVLPDHRAPVVTQMVYYHVGAADEAPGESGIAHFLEHLMFKGTKTHPERRVLPRGCRYRRPGERLHHRRLHRLLPAGPVVGPEDGHGLRGRPHGNSSSRTRW